MDWKVTRIIPFGLIPLFLCHFPGYWWLLMFLFPCPGKISGYDYSASSFSIKFQLLTWTIDFAVPITLTTIFISDLSDLSNTYQNFIRTLFHQWLILLYAKAGLWIFTPKYPQPANSTLLALVTIEHKRVLDNSGGQWSLMSLKAFVCLSIIFRWWRWKERVEFIVDIRW